MPNVNSSADDWSAIDWGAPGFFGPEWMKGQSGYDLSRRVHIIDGGAVSDTPIDDESILNDIFWQIQAIKFLMPKYNVDYWITTLDTSNVIILLRKGALNYYPSGSFAQQGCVVWDKDFIHVEKVEARDWHTWTSEISLAHELWHAWQEFGQGTMTAENLRRMTPPTYPKNAFFRYHEPYAYKIENLVRYAFYKKVPNYDHISPRTGGRWDFPDMDWDDWSPNWLPPFD